MYVRRDYALRAFTNLFDATLIYAALAPDERSAHCKRQRDCNHHISSAHAASRTHTHIFQPHIMHACTCIRAYNDNTTRVAIKVQTGWFCLRTNLAAFGPKQHTPCRRTKPNPKRIAIDPEWRARDGHDNVHITHVINVIIGYKSVATRLCKHCSIEI